MDAVIETDVNVLDIAALSLIVEEAGGRFTDLEGRAGRTGDQLRAQRPMVACTRRDPAPSALTLGSDRSDPGDRS